MPTRRSIATLGIAVALATGSIRAAEPAKAPPPAPAPSRSGPTGGTPAPAPAGAKQPPAAPAPPNGTTPNRNPQNPQGHRDERRAPRIVYVGGYGYTNWSGDYRSPYWNAQGPWYLDANQQSQSTPNAGAGADAATRAQIDAAQADMTAAQRRLAADFESNADVRDTLHEVREAQRGYDAAVAKVTQELKKNPEYKAAEAEKQQAQQKVEAVRAADQQAPSAPTAPPPPVSPEVVRAAQEKLDAKTEVNALVSDRAQQDPAVIAAREKLEAAADRLNGMKEKFDATLQSDPQWQAAHQKLDAARTGHSG